MPRPADVAPAPVELIPKTRLPRTRANGEGSIYQVVKRRMVCDPKDPTKKVLSEVLVWRATFTVEMRLSPDPDKRPYARKIVGESPSKTEALRRRDTNLQRWLVATGQAAPETLEPERKYERVTVAELLDRWWAWKSTTTEHGHRIGPSVAHMYRKSIDLHIATSSIGKMPIRLVRKLDLSTYLTDELARKKRPDGSPLLGSSPKRQIRNILTMAFRWATDQELIVKNPAERLPNWSKEYRTDEGLERMLDLPRQILEKVAGTPDEARVFLALIGCRPSEVLGLQWSCIENLDGSDPDAPVILEIRQQLWRDPSTGALSIVQRTKSAKSRRRLPLPTRLVEVLRAVKADQDYDRRLGAGGLTRGSGADQRSLTWWTPQPGLDDLIFTERLADGPLKGRSNGRPVSHQADNRAWHALLARYDLPDYRQYVARHLAISTMISLGYEAEFVAQVAGHDEAISRAVYHHLSYRTAVEPLNGLAASYYQGLNVEADRMERVASGTASTLDHAHLTSAHKLIANRRALGEITTEEAKKLLAT